ncbi:Protein Spindly-B [Holothuria leucospilota]|uniref:Protein Spindly-B n=1 Tax=Holothuria leucospilota TaxID=206669 RepID=A0A9Q1CJ42_HOLLE|nr:Protein Spindly-B [Holothuria leucospilota]
MDDCPQIIEELQQELMECQANLSRSAAAGKHLLEQNQMLEERYEQELEECNRRIESLEQSKYTLQMQLESKDYMEQQYEAELSNASDRNKREVAALTERLEMAHANEIQKWKNSNDSLKGDLELIRLKETQMQEKIKSLEERLEEAESNQNRTFMNMTSSIEDQVASLAEELTEVKAEKLLLLDQLTDGEKLCKQQELKVRSMSSRLEELQEMADDQHKQCVSYQRALEECRERLEEKQAELDLVRLESQDPNRKGNSLFAEVEVKRQEIEKKFISLKVQYDATKKRADFHKQRAQELKLQVANLLQTDDGRVAVSQYREIQQSLVRSRQQNQSLLQKLNEYEGKMDVKHASGSSCSKPTEDTTMEGGLAFLLEQSKKECDKLRKELKNERMMHLASEAKETQCQQQLNDLKKELDKNKAMNIKLELKISDLRDKVNLKGHTGALQTTKPSKGGRIEKITTRNKVSASHSEQGSTEGLTNGDDKENTQEQVSTNSGGRDEENCPLSLDEDMTQSDEGKAESKEEDTMGRNGLEERCMNSSALKDEKRQNGDLEVAKKPTASSKYGKKSVSISDDVEVIGLDETDGGTLLREIGNEGMDCSGSSSPPQTKRSRKRIVYVNKTTQNECKQQ